jgi:hypothetical protein|tara:strand:- start:8076 stop:8330 length:255 start_codon:yes stop_codon:yes gene_type:complete
MLISLTGKFKLVINLDKRNDNSLTLISYANDYGKMLDFTEQKRIDITNEMIDSINFDELLIVFLSYFGDYVEIYYKLKKVKINK